ncbi:acyl carrier protein [Actinocorallia sp. B10E7]|uniref:acyl carrier protein n=1 Tax=Actinocorallia sp. B10E7 TaxID=3153558 RepID=UPI00325E3C44
MSNSELAEPNAFLALVEEIYADLKQVRRSIRLDDVIAKDLGIDSLDALELLVSLEQRYSVELVGSPNVAAVKTVGDLYELLGRLTGARVG